MRVCLVSQEYPPDSASGGIGTQTWNKAHTLTPLGHRVHVLSCGSGSELRVASADGITVTRMAPPGRETDGPIPVHTPAAYMTGYTWSVFRHLHRLQESETFDLINFPEYGAEGFAYQLNRTPWNWTPVVVQLHGPLAMFTERIGWPEPGSEHAAVGAFMEGVSIRLADSLMASSANIADFTAEYYGVPRDRIDVVHCGIDLEMFSPPDEEARQSRRPTVLFVGNIAASKGVRTVFDAVMRLRARYPDILLRIAGKGEELTADLRKRARQAGAEGNVEFHGFVKSRADLPALYRDAHVFGSPAFHEVGVANVYVEAMACGCPVVASTTGGAPEAVEHEKSGLLVPPSDVEATTAALDRILGNADLRRRMGAAGRNRTETYFAREHYIARVLRAYENTLERSRETLERLRAEQG
jgi:glycosyltransferase involved in cell wall biosynthesis